MYEKIENFVEKHITGRIANKLGSQKTTAIQTLLKYVDLAGGGHHLEIGTLFGGSAIAVALLKLEKNQNGSIICIDPLDGYYPQYAPRKDKLDGCGEPVTPNTLFYNIDTFRVNQKILVMKSYSENIEDFYFMFTTAYIDGDHRGDAPLNDWKFVKDRTLKYVIFDNYDSLHPDVKKACEEANNDPYWQCIYKDEYVYVLEKI